MLAWKFLAETGSSMTACSPVTPKLDTFNPVQGFVKHRVRIVAKESNIGKAGGGVIRMWIETM